jgi:tricorn protease
MPSAVFASAPRLRRTRPARALLVAIATGGGGLAATTLTPIHALAAENGRGAADITPAAGMLRYPDVSREHIVFVYAGDIWLAPRTGGTATPLASPPGNEMFPRFSPDGKTIAFMGNYEGNTDLYTIPVTGVGGGGPATRITHHPSTEMLCDWTPDGMSLLYYKSGMGGLRRQTQLFTVPATGGGGGLPTQLPVPYGANGALSAADKDGNQWLAYTPHSTDFRTWKRYRGGMATDIWLFNLKDNTSRQITDWEGTDTLPMWHKDKVYYLADQGPEHRQNIWVFNTKSGHRKQVTKFQDFDVKWPSMGPGRHGNGEIIFQNGASLWLLDLETEQTRSIDVTIPGDRPTIRTRQVNAAEFISNWSISPSAARVAVEARGDIWSLPAEKGSPRNLTRTSGAAERDPAWSPDGRWIAFFSDESGEYQLYITQSDGQGPTRRLTSDECAPQVFRYTPAWSPDSKHILFSDKTGSLYLHTLAPVDAEGEAAQGKTVLVDKDPWANRLSANWSHDNAWLTYSIQHSDGRHSAIWLYNVGSGERHQVTSGMFHDAAPVFDRKGDYLYFSSRRNFSPTYSELDTTFIYNASHVLLAVPLRADIASPWLPKSDEEDWRKNVKVGGAEKKNDKKADDADAKDGESKSNGAASPAPDAATEDGLSGTWEGMVTGPAPIPPGGLPFTLTLTRAKDGAVTGTFTAAIYSGAIQNGRFDAASQTLTFTINAAGADALFELKIAGEEMSGSASAEGQNYPISGRRTGSGAGQGADVQAAEKPESKDDKKALVIDLDGFEARALQLPVAPGRFGRLAVNDRNQLIFARFSGGGSGDSGIKLFDLSDDKREEKMVAAGSSNFELSADGKKLLVMRGRSASIQNASAGASPTAIPTAAMTARINPREEWKQIFVDAWRIQRDFFYEPGMHGVDWPAMRERYGKKVNDAVSRDDISFIISEMISELNVGHAYYSGGDIPSGPSVSVGLLGCDFELVEQDGTSAYRISRIYQGAAWDSDARGPLSQPGVQVREGDFLLAVNGVPVDTSRDPWAPFVGLANRIVTLTVSDKPVLGASPAPEAGKSDADSKNSAKAATRPTGQRDVVVQTMASEDDLRYRAWIERNRAYVDEMTSGRVGYIYVPDTGVNGQNNLFRQFYGQAGKQALIIDERWNGGGQIPTRFIELLNRPRVNYWARRDGNDWAWPPDSHQGPKVMLINGLAGSGGDAFPSYFRQAGLGKLIGMRTWGGLVGISGNPGLIDGGNTTAPTFGFYKKDGNWGIEGHGVDPDIEVIDDPAKMVDGGDPQLDAAIQLMLKEIEERPYVPPTRPAGPNRAGMGIPVEQR